MAEKLNDILREQLKVAEKNISDLEMDIEKAKRIGLDVIALERELKSQKSQISLVKDVYGL